MQDVLRVRSVAHAVLNLVDFNTYEEMTQMFVRRIRKRQPDRERGPTINEVRTTDRFIHEEVLSFASRGTGTLDSGIQYFLNEGIDNKL